MLLKHWSYRKWVCPIKFDAFKSEFQSSSYTLVFSRRSLTKNFIWTYIKMSFLKNDAFSWKDVFLLPFFSFFECLVIDLLTAQVKFVRKPFRYVVSYRGTTIITAYLGLCSMLVIEFNLNIYNLDFGTENIFPNRTQEIVSAARLGI